MRYTLADDWYQKFAQRIFLITDYLRTRDQMDFTPEPDMFHDIFGHLPYLTLDFYARIEDKFAPAYLKATRGRAGSDQTSGLVQHRIWTGNGR